MNTVGVIEKIDYLTGTTYYGEPAISKFDDKLKKALLSVACIVLTLEINYNVEKMRPYYSPMQLEGTWKAPSLLTALYFSTEILTLKFIGSVQIHHAIIASLSALRI